MDTLTSTDNDGTLRRLRHLLWQYQKGSVLRERLARELGFALGASRARFEAMSSSVGGLANLGAEEAALASRVDSLLRAADNRINFYEFPAALALVEEAMQWLKVVDQRVELRGHTDRARELVAAISREVGEDLQILKRLKGLLVQASTLCRETRYRAAQFVVLLCLNEGERLVAASKPDDPAAIAVLARAQRQRTLEAVLSVLPVPPTARMEITGALAVIERQIRHHRFVLAAGLLDELEAATDPAAVCIAELNRQTKLAKVEGDRGRPEWMGGPMESADDWLDATSNLLRQSLDHLMKQVAGGMAPS